MMWWLNPQRLKRMPVGFGLPAGRIGTKTEEAEHEYECE
jgi:hypothetical protein